MARQSEASMMVATSAAIDGRLQPTVTLTDAEKSLWMRFVNARPATWFGEEHRAMLCQLCRHTLTADIVAQQIESFDPEWLGDRDGLNRYNKLLAMQERESRAITTLMRSMRLTQQSLIRAEKVVPTESLSGRKPWDRPSTG